MAIYKKGEVIAWQEKNGTLYCPKCVNANPPEVVPLTIADFEELERNGLVELATCDECDCLIYDANEQE